MKLLSRYADIIAIPFWVIAVYYFWSIKDRNTLEDLLLLFTICGLVFDTVFTLSFLGVFKSLKTSS